MSKIIQIEDQKEIGLHRRDVFGLNILSVNNVEDQFAENLFVLFFRELCKRYNCSAHFGNLHDMADAPEDLFGSPNEVSSYKLSKTGIYGRSFYDAEKWNNFPSCFFPNVKDEFWKSRRTDDHDEINFAEIVHWDAVALYVEPKYNPKTNLDYLLQRPYSSDERWTQELSGLYQIVITTGGDGFYLHAYAENLDAFDLLTPAINAVEETVEAMDWYQQNKERFEWEPKLRLCLELPENKRKFKNL